MTKKEQEAIDAVKSGNCFHYVGRMKQGGRRYGAYFYSEDKSISSIVLAKLFNKKVICDGGTIHKKTIDPLTYKLTLNEFR